MPLESTQQARQDHILPCRLASSTPDKSSPRDICACVHVSIQAPNPVIDELCPANKANRAKYNVPPGQVIYSRAFLCRDTMKIGA